MKSLLSTLTVFSLAAACQSAWAGMTILDLESATVGTALDGRTTFTEDGYQFEYWAGDNPIFVDTGSNIAIGDGIPGVTPGSPFSLAAGLRISRIDGQPFDLLAFDVANIGAGDGTNPAIPNDDPENMSIAAGGQTLQFSPAAGAGFVTETITDPAFTGVTEVNVSLFWSTDFGAGDANFVADNFKVGGGPQVNVIPEPASVGLGILGLGGLALQRRRGNA